MRRLQSICGSRHVLPRSYLIQSERLSKGQIIASGGFADAHEAELDGKKVCVKALRVYIRDSEGVTKRVRLYFRSSPATVAGMADRQAFYREVVVWKRLQHPNIVPFLGIPANIPPFEIVCDWMENDRITEYVKKNPDVNRVDLVSGFILTVTTLCECQILQLWDVVDGIHYLHSCNVIHGDLKGVSHLILHVFPRVGY